MNSRTIRLIAIGVLLGVGLFFVPFFVLRIAVFILIIGIVLRLFAGRRRFGRHFMDRRIAFADHIRNMNEEEYNKFKAGFASGCGPEFPPQSPTDKKDK